MSSTMSLIPKKKNVPNTVGIRDIVPNTEFCGYWCPNELGASDPACGPLYTPGVCCVNKHRLGSLSPFPFRIKTIRASLINLCRLYQSVWAVVSNP